MHSSQPIGRLVACDPLSAKAIGKCPKTALAFVGFRACYDSLFGSYPRLSGTERDHPIRREQYSPMTLHKHLTLRLSYCTVGFPGVIPANSEHGFPKEFFIELP